MRAAARERHLSAVIECAVGVLNYTQLQHCRYVLRWASRSSARCRAAACQQPSDSKRGLTSAVSIPTPHASAAYGWVGTLKPHRAMGRYFSCSGGAYSGVPSHTCCTRRVPAAALQALAWDVLPAHHSRCRASRHHEAAAGWPMSRQRQGAALAQGTMQMHPAQGTVLATPLPNMVLHSVGGQSPCVATRANPQEEVRQQNM